MKPYYWFQGKSVVELVERLVAADPETCRLEVHEQDEKMTFIVRTAATGLASAEDDGCDPINDSHRCPPDC